MTEEKDTLQKDTLQNEPLGWARRAVGALLGFAVVPPLFLYGLRFIGNFVIGEEALLYCRQLSCGHHFYFLLWLVLCIFCGVKIGQSICRNSLEPIKYKTWTKHSKIVVGLAFAGLAGNIYVYKWATRHAGFADMASLFLLLCCMSVLAFGQDKKV